MDEYFNVEDGAVLSDDELFKLISKSADTGQALVDLIGTRRFEGPVPPIITIGGPLKHGPMTAEHEACMIELTSAWAR